MRTVIFIPALLLLCKLLSAQAPADFKENTLLNIEGIDFLYNVGPEEVKTIDNVPYSFYTVEWSATNKGRSSKVFLLDKDNKVKNASIDMTKRAYLAKVQVTNGVEFENAKKSDFISSEPNMEILTYSKKAFILTKRNSQPGFNLEPGQTLSSTFRTAVFSKGVKPNLLLVPIISELY